MDIQETLKEIAKFQFILSEGKKGHHLLFSPKIIREAFSKDPETLKTLFEEKIEDINEALNHSFSLATFEEKRTYIASLPEDVRDSMVFGYFQLLEGADEDADIVH